MSDADSGSTSSDLSSDSDSDNGADNMVFFDWTLADEASKAIKRHERQPLPGAAPPPGANPPADADLDGDWTYVEFIPKWTAPDWDDEHIIPITEHGKPIKIRRRDLTQLVRPALLPGDALRNPTPYALRYGMHPDRHDGRSNISPTISSTRRVGLSRVQDTYTGRKAYVDYQDLSMASQAAGGIGNLLASLATMSKDDSMFEQLSAMANLFESTEEDLDYQRVLFDNLTTDERISHMIHSLDSQIVPQSTLSGDLHPLLERTQWPSTTWRGADEDKPRFMFNILGNRGEYSVENELIWMALQPALQLASNILNSKHPAWIAILDLYSRHHVDPNREHKNPGAGGQESDDEEDPDLPLCAIFDHLAAPSVSNDVQRLRQNSAFDVVKAAAEFLKEHLELELSSAYLSGDDDKKAGQENPVWGVTRLVLGMDFLNPADSKIHLELASEMIWPLLVPSYTMAEKATCSLVIANVVLHELAHAAQLAVQHLFDNWEDVRDKIPQLAELSNLDPPATAAFTRVALNATYYRGFHLHVEPFYRHEPRAELGFAFENQLWGGTIDGLNEGKSTAFPMMEFHPIDLHLEEWPSGKQKASHRKGEETLASPPLPVDSFSTFIPMKETGKLFQKSFWETHAAKFGHRALRLGSDESGLVTTRREYLRLKDKRKVLARLDTKFLAVAMRKMRHSGQSLFVMYLEEMIKVRIGPLAMHSRWRAQAKVWPSRAKEFGLLTDRVEAESYNLMQCYQHVNVPDEDKAARAAQATMSLGQYKEHLVQTAYQTTEALLLACIDVHRFLLAQIQQTQHMVVEYLQMKPEDRTPFYNRYLTLVHETLKDHYESTASGFASKLEIGYAHLQQMGIASQELSDIFGSMIRKFKSDESLCQQARSYMTEAGRDYAGPTPQVFSSVPKAFYRQRHKILEKMAFRELKHMPTGVRQMADQCFKLLQIPIPSEKQTVADASLVTQLECKLQETQPKPTSPAPAWLTPANRPKPTAVTNMGATALPPLNPQLYSALQFHPSPQSAPISVLSPDVSFGGSSRLTTVPFGTDPAVPAPAPDIGKNAINRQTLENMFGDRAYLNGVVSDVKVQEGLAAWERDRMREAAAEMAEWTGGRRRADRAQQEEAEGPSPKRK